MRCPKGSSKVYHCLRYVSTFLTSLHSTLFPQYISLSHFEKRFPTWALALSPVLYSNLWHIFSLFSISLARTLLFIRTTLFYNPRSYSALPAIFTPSGLWNHNLTSHCPPLKEVCAPLTCDIESAFLFHFPNCKGLKSFTGYSVLLEAATVWARVGNKHFASLWASVFGFRVLGTHSGCEAMKHIMK